MILSNPYPKRSTALAAAKKQERCIASGKILILYNHSKKWFIFVDGEINPDLNMSVAGRYELVNGKWRDKTPLGQVHCGDGYTVKTSGY
jgi:hypothetical protein